MKKILQTCFLALLCLAGSNLTASSKVADSPGADLLHKFCGSTVSPHSGDTHRGGDFRPDTFHYTIGHEIDGGPIAIVPIPIEMLNAAAGSSLGVSRHCEEVSNWSKFLLSSKTDEAISSKGAVNLGIRLLRSVPPLAVTFPVNETASSPSGAPRSDVHETAAVGELSRTVAGELSRSVDCDPETANCKLETAFCKLATANWKAGFSLVDDSNSQGQEDSIPSAQAGFFTLKGLLKSSPTEKQRLSYKLSAQEIDPYYGRAQLSEDSITLVSGSFYAGTSGSQVFELQIPVPGGFGRLGIYDGGSPWLEDIWVRAGDSLVLHREGTRLFFSGPSADAVRIQIQLQELFAASMADLNPVMILSDARAMLNTPAKTKAYQDAVDSFVPGWSRHMVWLEREADKLTRAKELFSAAGNGHPVLAALERNRDLLDTERYRWLYGYWKGRLASQALQFAAIAKPASADWASVILENSLEANFSDPQQGKAPAELVEAFYLENKLLSTLTPVSFLHLSESLTDPLEEQVNALYLVREYKELSEVDSLFRQVIDKTQSPEILMALEQLYRSSLKGSDFASFAFEDEVGSQVFPEEWKGKLVMIDFWLSGCGACLKFASESFLPLLDEFKDHPGLVIVTVAGDSSKELWKQSLASGKYTNGQALNLFSGGASHPTLRENLIQSFPAQLILDREGKILQTGSFPDDRQGWINLIKSYLGERSPAGASTNPNAFSPSSPKPY